jgi:DNA polymerase-3 subunit gamma/tau
VERRLSVSGAAAPETTPARESAPAREIDPAPSREVRGDARGGRAAAQREPAPREAPREPAQPERAQGERAQPERAQGERAQPERAQPERAQREAAQREPARPEPARREPAQPEPAQPEPVQPPPAADVAPTPRAPEPRPHTPVGELDATAVRRIWPEVLDAVKRLRRTAHALLMNVSVHSVDNGVLTLTISSVPLSRLLAQDANTDVVRAAVKDVLGVDWRIAVVVDGAGPAGGGDPAATPPPDDDPRDEEPSPTPSAAPDAPRVDPEAAAISLLQSTLGARRMEG